MLPMEEQRNSNKDHVGEMKNGGDNVKKKE
jgi:hypothetical protein